MTFFLVLLCSIVVCEGIGIYILLKQKSEYLDYHDLIDEKLSEISNKFSELKEYSDDLLKKPIFSDIIEVRKWVGLLKTSTSEVDKTINDLLEMSGIKSGEEDEKQ